MNLASAWRIATQASVVLRSLRVALVVGSVLVAINHGDTLWRGAVTVGTWGKILLTYCVPYCVATYAAVAALMGRH